MSAQKLITEHLDLWTGAITSKSSSGRGNSSKINLIGIIKLRELILELAVRGKLAEQKSGDTPARKLILKVIEESESSLLIEAKSPNYFETTQDTSPYTAPPAWAWAKVGDLFDIVYGKGLPTSKLTDEGYDVFGANGIIGKYTEYTYEQPQLLISCRGAYSGKANISPSRCFITSNTLILRNSWKHLNLQYFYYALTAADKSKIVTGSAQPQVTTTNLRPFLVAVPPLEEQRRIVQKVDELMALCDRLEQQTSDQLEAHETLVDTLLGTLTQSENATDLADNWARLATHFDTLFTTEQSIDKLKQTILQLAVMGRLVEQTASDAPAQDLLDQIKSKRVSLYKEGVIPKPKPLPPISADEHYMEIPAGWAWARFGETGCTRLGKMLDKAKNSGTERPYLRNTNVQWWRVDVDDVKTFKLESHELDEYRLQKDDLLICEGGEPGRCAVYRDSEVEMYFQKAIHRHRTLGLCSPDYLKICLTVDAHNGRLSERFTGATIKHLPGDKLMTHVCPIPPKQEQYRIVGKVDELMTLCDQLKDSLNQASEIRCQLASAIVEQGLSA